MSLQWNHSVRKEKGVYILTREDDDIPATLRDAQNVRLACFRCALLAKVVELRNLVELEILDYTLDSFAPLAGLSGLKKLEVTHFAKVHSLRPIGQLASLKFLTLTTLGSWYNKKQLVDTFRPLAKLSKLQVLDLRGVLAEDGKLAPLGALVNLDELYISNFYPQEELARLAGHLPHVRGCWFLSPFVKMDGDNCRKCRKTKVMLSGSDIRPGIICPECQRIKFDDCVSRFQDMVAEEMSQKQDAVRTRIGVWGR
jgi:hypothetical protein